MKIFMEELNYTPIDTRKLEAGNKSKLNFYLLLIATLVAAFFAVLLFILIRTKQSQTSASPVVTPVPTETLSPTEVLPSPTPAMDEEVEEATETPTLPAEAEIETPEGTESAE